MKDTKKTSENIEHQSMIEAQNKYETKIISMVDEMDEKIKDLKLESGKLKESAKEKIDEQIVFLAKKKDELQESLVDLKKNSADQWVDIKQTIEGNIKNMEREVKEVYDGFQGGLNYMISKLKKGQ